MDSSILFHPSYKRPLVSSWQQKEEEKNNNDRNKNEQKKKTHTRFIYDFIEKVEIDRANNNMCALSVCVWRDRERLKTKEQERSRLTKIGALLLRNRSRVSLLVVSAHRFPSISHLVNNFYWKYHIETMTK